jgi:hypothetical protein
VRGQVSYPNKTTGKITILYISTFMFFWHQADFWADWWQTFPKFNLLFISSRITFLFDGLDLCGSG